MMECMAPWNVHTIREGQGKFWRGDRRGQKLKRFFEESVKAHWIFQIGRMGMGFNAKHIPREGSGYFLEPHNLDQKHGLGTIAGCTEKIIYNLHFSLVKLRCCM